jgi:hypothetical protein
MKPGRIVAIVVGSLLAIPSLAIFVGGAAVTVASAVEAGDDGYFDETLDRLSSATAAITTEDVDFRTDPGPRWVMDVLDVSVRLQVAAVDGDAELFVGIGPEADVEAFLSGVARDEIRDVRWGGDVRYRALPGERSAALPPGGEGFWVASTSGAGALVLDWDVDEGQWIAVLMNADGSPGILADVTVGVQSGALLGVGIVMLVVGLVLSAAAVAIILAGSRRRVAEVEAEPEVPSALEPRPSTAHPVRLEAAIDSPLSPWMWLVKWLLAVPHVVVLALLWVAFAVLTVVAGVAILFTGRYPRGIFDFNVGVMRWSWRVLFYAASGGLGTDRYPPFSLGAEPDYPATLDVAYPAELSRGLVLVKWWLLAIPHYLVLALMVGGGLGWWWSDDWGSGAGTWGGGLVGVLVFIAAVILLFTGRYPQPLFDLIVGLNRWAFRVFAYAALLTDRYPPFRLDQGGREPDPEEESPPAGP